MSMVSPFLRNTVYFLHKARKSEALYKCILLSLSFNYKRYRNSSDFCTFALRLHVLCEETYRLLI